jgi:DNA repair exonuclease SbcCD ATPase subunit
MDTEITESNVAQDAFIAEVTQQPVAPVVEEPADNPLSKYTEDDLRRVREQEKSKLYPQIDNLKEELNLLKKEREERLAEEARLREAAEAEARRKAEEEMDVRELLKNKETEWALQLEAERLEREQAFALLEKERSYAELNEYRNRRVSEEQEAIIPELVDLISGNTPEEIDASIAGLRDRSSRILDSAQQAMQSARREMTGSRVTAPPTGPLDTNSDNQQFTAEQISAMSVSEYAKYRSKLLGQAASARGKGLFG